MEQNVRNLKRSNGNFTIIVKKKKKKKKKRGFKINY